MNKIKEVTEEEIIQAFDEGWNHESKKKCPSDSNFCATENDISGAKAVATIIRTREVEPLKAELERLKNQTKDIRYSYSSTQETDCAGCGKHKHTPLRNDEMGGYVCLTCIDKELERLQRVESQLQLSGCTMSDEELINGFHQKGSELSERRGTSYTQDVADALRWLIAQLRKPLEWLPMSEAKSGELSIVLFPDGKSGDMTRCAPDYQSAVGWLPASILPPLPEPTAEDKAFEEIKAQFPDITREAFNAIRKAQS